jgi:hypothetical protein
MRIRKKGALMRRESIESMIPPLPIIIVPESLTFAPRLRADSIKSPILLMIETTNPKAIPSIMLNIRAIAGMKDIQRTAMVILEAMPPIKPARLLLGLTVKILRLLFPNHIPKMYANVSFPNTSKKSMSNRSVLCSNMRRRMRKTEKKPG